MRDKYINETNLMTEKTDFRGKFYLKVRLLNKYVYVN